MLVVVVFVVVVVVVVVLVFVVVVVGGGGGGALCVLLSLIFSPFLLFLSLMNNLKLDVMLEQCANDPKKGEQLLGYGKKKEGAKPGNKDEVENQSGSYYGTVKTGQQSSPEKKTEPNTWNLDSIYKAVRLSDVRDAPIITDPIVEDSTGIKIPNEAEFEALVGGLAMLVPGRAT